MSLLQPGPRELEASWTHLCWPSCCELVLPMHKVYSQGCVPELWQHRSLVAEACIWVTCGEFLWDFVGLGWCLFVGFLFAFCLFVFNTRIKLLKLEPQWHIWCFRYFNKRNLPSLLTWFLHFRPAQSSVCCLAYAVLFLGLLQSWRHCATASWL